MDDPGQRVKATGRRCQHGDAYWTLDTSATAFLPAGHTEVHGPIPLYHDESCAGVAVPGRQTASSKRGDGYGGRGAAAERHDNGERIQTPAEQPPVQRRVLDFKEDHLSDFLSPLRFSSGPAEARGGAGRALLSKDFLRGEEVFSGELARCFQCSQRGEPALL